MGWVPWAGLACVTAGVLALIALGGYPRHAGFATAALLIVQSVAVVVFLKIVVGDDSTEDDALHPRRAASPAFRGRRPARADCG